MKPPSKPSQRSAVKLILGSAIAVLALGAVTTWWATRSQKTVEQPPTPAPITSPQTPLTQERAKIYWLDANQDDIAFSPSPFLAQRQLSEQEVLKSALSDLLTGTEDSQQYSEIPSNTRLLSMSIESDGVHLNLSEDFVSGGGSNSMISRLAQVLYTATSIEPSTQVWLEVSGEPLTLLGGEGIEIEQPLTRRQFEENFELQ